MRMRGFALCLALAAGLAASASPAETRASLYPSPHRVWTQQDYVQFYFTHFNGNQALPHLRSAEMRAVFERLVHADNLARLAAAPISDAEKLGKLRLMLSALGEVRAAYNISVQVGEPLAEELTRVQVFTIEMLAQAVGVSALAGEVPSRAWTTTTFGIVVSLGEDSIYSPVQRRALAEALAQHYDSLRTMLSGPASAEIGRRIASLAAKERDPALRQSLTRLAEAASGG